MDYEKEKNSGTIIRSVEGRFNKRLFVEFEEL